MYKKVNNVIYKLPISIALKDFFASFFILLLAVFLWILFFQPYFVCAVVFNTKETKKGNLNDQIIDLIDESSLVLMDDELLADDDEDEDEDDTFMQELSSCLYK